MKINNVRRKPASIGKTRWLAYATAGAATALAGNNSAEAAIHYSGLVWEQFGPHLDKAKAFPLDQPGDSFVFNRVGTAFFPSAGFGIGGIVSAYVAATDRQYLGASVRKFGSGVNVLSLLRSSSDYRYGFLARNNLSHNQGYWIQPGIGFVAFKFNNGAGAQYGWARVKMSKSPERAFAVIDYAYADPGEPITTGQRSSDEQVPDQGSLGGLALGAVGLMAWRKSRSRTARIKDA